MGLTTKRPESIESKVARLKFEKMKRKENLELLKKEKQLNAEKEKVISESNIIDRDDEKEKKKNQNLEKLKIEKTIKEKSKNAVSAKNKLIKEGIDKLLDVVLFKTVMESFPADEQIKNDINLWYNEFKSVSSMLESSCEKNSNNQLMENIIDIIHETAEEHVNKKLTNEYIDDYSKIFFKLDDDESETFNYKIGKLDLKTIEKTVKDNIVQVINNENKRNKERSDIINDLKEKVREQEEKLEDDTINESASQAEINFYKAKINDILNSDSTLFESLNIHFLKKLNDKNELLEGTKINNPQDMHNIALINSIFNYTVLEVYDKFNIYNLRNSNSIKSIVKNL